MNIRGAPRTSPLVLVNDVLEVLGARRTCGGRRALWSPAPAIGVPVLYNGERSASHHPSPGIDESPYKEYSEKRKFRC